MGSTAATGADIDGDGDGVRRLEAWRLRLVTDVGKTPPQVVAAGALDRARQALAGLGNVDVDALSAADLRCWMESVEALRRTIDSTAVAAVGVVDRSNPFRPQGWSCAKTVVQHVCGLSGPEAHRRVQTARLHAALPDWAHAEAEGLVGVAQCRLMARIAANPRIPAAVLERDSPSLLDDAIGASFAEFELRARTWEALADPAGDRARHERLHADRSVRIRPRPEGGWTITGSLAELAGCEFNEILAWFLQAEWEADWADARDRHGDQATTAHLARTQAQRTADALLAMARAAASTPPGSRPPRPTVNILYDTESFEAHLRGETPDPRRSRDVVIRTSTGRRLHPDDAVNAALIGHIRRVVIDTAGTVIDLGRRRRLFTGAARDAVMLLTTTCAWIGCTRPTAWCHADHSLEWNAHGPTVPRNGQPLCPSHHRLKDRGYHVHRDTHGDWHVTDPHGNDIT
jgi:hypothetical protein